MGYANPYAVDVNPLTPGVGPLSDPSSWDYVTVAGRRSPGVIPKGGLKFKRKYKWDKKEGKGSAGATATFTGQPLAEGTVRFQLWTDAHIASWARFLQLLSYDPEKAEPVPVDIDHPALRQLRIRSIFVEEVGNIEHVGGGLYEVEITCTEFRPPPKVNCTGTPKAATPDTVKDDDADAPTPLHDPVFEAKFNERLRKLQATNLFKRMSKP